MTDNATRAGSIRALHASTPPQLRPPAPLTPEQAVVGAVQSALRKLTKPATLLEQLVADGDIDAVHAVAVQRLAADLHTVATRHRQDPADTDARQDVWAVDDDGNKVGAQMGIEWTLYPIGEPGIRPFPAVSDFHRRAMVRATALGRVQAAVEALGELDVRLLQEAAEAPSWAAVGRSIGIGDPKKAKRYAVSAAHRLAEHQRSLDDDRTRYDCWREEKTCDCPPEPPCECWRRHPNWIEVRDRCRARTLSNLTLAPMESPPDPRGRSLLAAIAELDNCVTELGDSGPPLRRSLKATIASLTASLLSGGPAQRSRLSDWLAPVRVLVKAPTTEQVTAAQCSFAAQQLMAATMADKDLLFRSRHECPETEAEVV